MLVEVSSKFSNYVYNSKHYLNCPKHILNYQLRCMIQLCYGHYDIAVQRVQEAKKFYSLSIPNIDELIKYHWNTKEKDFNNPNPYIDNMPDSVLTRHNYINSWYARNTKETWCSGVLVYRTQPSFPFQEK